MPIGQDPRLLSQAENTFGDSASNLRPAARAGLRSVVPGLVGGRQLTDDPAASQILAELVAMYLVTADELADLRPKAGQLQHALLSRIVIEQAKGIIAASNDISIDDAFRALRRYARGHNAAIHDVADAVVNRGLRP